MQHVTPCTSTSLDTSLLATFFGVSPRHGSRVIHRSEYNSMVPLFRDLPLKCFALLIKIGSSSQRLQEVPIGQTSLSENPWLEGADVHRKPYTSRYDRRFAYRQTPAGGELWGEVWGWSWLLQPIFPNMYNGESQQRAVNRFFSSKGVLFYVKKLLAGRLCSGLMIVIVSIYEAMQVTKR